MSEPQEDRQTAEITVAPSARSMTVYSLLTVTNHRNGCLAWVATVAACTTAVVALLRLLGG